MIKNYIMDAYNFNGKSFPIFGERVLVGIIGLFTFCIQTFPNAEAKTLHMLFTFIGNTSLASPAALSFNNLATTPELGKPLFHNLS